MEKILKSIGYAPLTGIIEGSGISNPESRKEFVVETTTKSSTEGWGFNGYREDLKDIIVFSGDYKIKEAGEETIERQDPYRESCTYRYHIKRKVLHFTDDFSGIIQLETSETTTGNERYLLENIYIKNPKTNVKVKFYGYLTYIDASGEKKNVTGYYIPEEYSDYFKYGKNVVTEIDVYRKYRDKACVTAKEIKKALTDVGLNIKVTPHWEWINRKQHREELEEFEEEIKEIYEKLLKKLENGAILEETNEFSTCATTIKKTILNEEVYYYDTYAGNAGSGYSKITEERIFGIPVWEEDYEEDAKWRGNELEVSVIRDEKYFIGREYEKILRDYLYTLENIAEKNKKIKI